jgi:Sigma-70 region 2
MARRGATTRELQDLYHARFEHFVRVAASICGDGDTGRDAVQAAFVSAVRTRRSFRGEGPLEAWVWRGAYAVPFTDDAGNIEVGAYDKRGKPWLERRRQAALVRLVPGAKNRNVDRRPIPLHEPDDPRLD